MIDQPLGRSARWLVSHRQIMSLTHRFRLALPAAGLHFLASVLVAAVAAFLVFVVWFPYPYRDLVGGRELFILVTSVDVVCGPLLTLVLFNHLKSRRELALDLALVACIQVAALAYGMYTVAQSRPIYLAFEVDRFRAVTASDIQREALKPELGGLQRIGWRGPQVIGVREPKDNQEMMRSLDLSLSGFDPSVRPDWWVPYESVKTRVLQKSKPLRALFDKRPSDVALIQAAVKESGLKEEQLVWMPVTSFQSTGWVALLDKGNASIAAFAPVDGF